MNNLLFELLHVALGKLDVLPYAPTLKEWPLLYEQSEEQAITGIMLLGIEKLPAEQRPPQDLLLQWIGMGQMIQQRNTEMDGAVVSLCKHLDEISTQYKVVKGQTLNVYYYNKNARQSGDIDFLVHPIDWDKAYVAFASEPGECSFETHSEKHIEWEKNGISYEMHRRLNDFSSKKHQRYWDEVVMKEAWIQPFTVEINGYKVPTLAPLYNVLYVFVHLFYHFINEGVGLRQFLDWYFLLLSYDFTADDKEVLEKHLKGIGLYRAFVVCGAVLTDYLGLDNNKFPFEISEKDHQNSYKLIDNILVKGNFGHNTNYVQPHGVIHGLQQFWQVLKQCSRFGKYAPSESWGYLLVKVRWWFKKLKRVTCITAWINRKS